MTRGVPWLRHRLANWVPALGHGEGSIESVRRRVWRLEWEGRRYSVKAPRTPEERTPEATLQQALHSAGYPVPRVCWEDEDTGIFVMEWADGPSLEDVLKQPRGEGRNEALAGCVQGLAHLEQGSGIVEAVVGSCEPAAPDPREFADGLIGLAEGLVGEVEAGRLQRACEAVAEVIWAEPPRPLGVVDILPRDVVVSGNGAVFLDLWPTGWWWSERRFCHYFARFQQDRPDRSFQSECFLQHFPRATAPRLDAHYLWHDLQHLRGWQEIRDSPTERKSLRGELDSLIDAGRERLTWPGACPAANEVRALLRDHLSR